MRAQKQKPIPEGNSPKDMMSPMSTNLLKIKRTNEKKSTYNSDKFSLKNSFNGNLSQQNSNSSSIFGRLAPCSIGNSPEATKISLKGAMQNKKNRK